MPAQQRHARYSSTCRTEADQGRSARHSSGLVDLKAGSILELTIDPDLGAGEAVATLAEWRLT
jgi:hypothetical protein